MPHLHRLLLTRPRGASDRVLAALTTALGRPPEAVISPLFDIVPVAPQRPLPAAAALVLSSANGARRAAELGYSGPAWCVGARTAALANQLGFQARSADGAAADLIAMIQKARPKGPLLHLHGRHTTGDIAARLTAGGIETRGLVVYDQRPVALSAAARDLLDGDQTVVIPLYSPATARQFAAQPQGKAPQRTIAISAATAQCLSQPAQMIHTVDAPTGAAMQEAILQALTDCTG